MPVSVSLPQHVRKLFQDPNYGQLATLMPDGSPQVSVVWVDIDGDGILINTSEGRVKPRNVRDDPRVAISIYEQANPYNSAAVRGRVVELRHEGAEDHIHRLAKKYLGQERYAFLRPGERRVIIVIEPEHVSSMTRE